MTDARRDGERNAGYGQPGRRERFSARRHQILNVPQLTSLCLAVIVRSLSLFYTTFVCLYRHIVMR